MGLVFWGPKFQDEEELEQWYSEEKERLEAHFFKITEGHLNVIPKAKAQYSANLKKLIVKYQEEYEKMLPRLMKK